MIDAAILQEINDEILNDKTVRPEKLDEPVEEYIQSKNRETRSKIEKERVISFDRSKDKKESSSFFHSSGGSSLDDLFGEKDAKPEEKKASSRNAYSWSSEPEKKKSTEPVDTEDFEDESNKMAREWMEKIYQSRVREAERLMTADSGNWNLFDMHKSARTSKLEYTELTKEKRMKLLQQKEPISKALRNIESFASHQFLRITMGDRAFKKLVAVIEGKDKEKERRAEEERRKDYPRSGYYGYGYGYGR